MIKPTRRQFLRLTAGALGGAGLSQRTSFARAATYGSVSNAILVDSGDLALPPGFRYVKFGSFGDPMTDGTTTPSLHDGMAAFNGPGGNIRLVRNHELGEGNDIPPGSALGQSAPATYDPVAPGGTVTLEWNPGSERVVRSFVSLNGTDTNCAGGPTPWGTWLSCEETTAGTKAGHSKPHGYVFEVSAAANGVVAAQPLKAMGRFVHEAAAVDPSTSVVYLTEDQGPRDGSTVSSPIDSGSCAAGRYRSCATRSARTTTRRDASRLASRCLVPSRRQVAVRERPGAWRHLRDHGRLGKPRYLIPDIADSTFNLARRTPWRNHTMWRFRCVRVAAVRGVRQ